MRTFLTAFGVVWGVFMLIVMIGAGNGLRNGVQGIFTNVTTNGLDVEPGKTSMEYKGMNRNRQVKFYNDDVATLKRQIPELNHIAPGVYVHQNVVVRGALTGSYSVMGNSDEFQYIDRLRMDFGRYFNCNEVRQNGKVAVIGQLVYEQMFREGGNPVGQYIKINNVFFMIVGKFKSTHDGGWAEWQNNLIIIPYTTAQRTFNFGNELHFMSIEANHSVSVSDIVPRITGVLAALHKIDPNDKQAFVIRDYSKEFAQATSLVTGIYILIWIVGTFTLLAGIIGISNIMLITVKERTREIGIKRALGATPANIVFQIITETAFLTTLSGYIGFLLGIGVLELLNNIASQSKSMFFVNPGVDLSVALSCMGILLIAAILAGFIPAKRAVNIKPIEAIRE